jgi:hypothetical protein
MLLHFLLARLFLWIKIAMKLQTWMFVIVWMLKWLSYLKRYKRIENRSIKKYDFGRFVPRLPENVKKTLLTWIIWCDPCQKVMCTNIWKSFNLSNFGIHLQPKVPLKCGVPINKSKHELILLEQRNVIKFDMKVGTTIELIDLKRRSWIVKYFFRE